jgi:hypothetical protein
LARGLRALLRVLAQIALGALQRELHGLEIGGWARAAPEQQDEDDLEQSKGQKQQFKPRHAPIVAGTGCQSAGLRTICRFPLAAP